LGSLLLQSKQWKSAQQLSKQTSVRECLEADMAKGMKLSLLVIIPMVAFATVMASPSHSHKTKAAPDSDITIEPLKMHSLVDVTKMATQQITDLF
jgi:hypothetical protein